MRNATHLRPLQEFPPLAKLGLFNEKIALKGSWPGLGAMVNTERLSAECPRLNGWTTHSLASPQPAFASSAGGISLAS
jgi:hypothetical protein